MWYNVIMNMCKIVYSLNIHIDIHLSKFTLCVQVIMNLYIYVFMQDVYYLFIQVMVEFIVFNIFKQ